MISSLQISLVDAILFVHLIFFPSGIDVDVSFALQTWKSCVRRCVNYCKVSFLVNEINRHLYDKQIIP